MGTAAYEGGESVLAILTKQHREIDELFEQAERACYEEPDRAAWLIAQLADRLLAHTRAEEVVVYPRFATIEGAGRQLDAARHQHATMVEDLEDLLEQLTPSEAKWRHAFASLKRAVQAHVAEEEDLIFPLARAALDRDESIALGAAALRVMRDIAPGVGPPPVGVTGQTSGAHPRR